MHLKQAIQIIESGDPFNIGYFTCDRKKQTGGDYVIGEQVRTTGPVNRKRQDVNILFQDNEYRRVHLKLITEINGELIV